ncbi:MAG TPA: spore coat protein U domain-containing protein [Thermoanaerobaculia bacterium]
MFASNCFWLTSPSAVSFGSYSVFSPTNLSTASQFSFRCTPNSYARVTLSTGGSGVYTPSRTMANGANSANYNLYLDPAGTQIWGNTTGGSVTYDAYNSTPQSKDFIDNIYGIAPASQDPAAGTYTDTVFATLSYSNNLGGPYNPVAPVAIAVSMTVLAECRVDSFNLNFGSYNPFNVAALAQSTLLKVYCTKNSSPTSVALNNGSFPLGAQKRMISPGGVFLSYNAALGSTAGSSTSSLIPINGGFALNGNVPAQQDVDVGSYLDTLVATVNY